MDKNKCIKIVNTGLYGTIGNGGTFVYSSSILDEFLLEERRKKLEKIKSKINETII